MAAAGRPSHDSVVADYHSSLENFAEQQRKVLERLLTKDAACEYLQRHGLKGRTDVKTFKQLVPVIEYEEIEADVARIAQADASPILTCEPVIRFYASSGTTSGKRKLVPSTRLGSETTAKMSVLIQALTSRLQQSGSPAAGEFEAAQPPEPAGPGLGLCFWTAGKVATSPGGLPIGVPTTFLFTGPHFPAMASATITSPHQVVQCPDTVQSTYCHFLCGLARAGQVTSLGAILASGIALAFRMLQGFWPDLCRDIEAGEVDGARVTDPAAREAVARVLRAPDPSLAAAVRAECARESWEGIVLRLWPRVRVVSCVTTGTMEQYVEYIRFLTGGKVQLTSPLYIGSEGCYGVNPCLWNPPSETFYVMLHDQNIYFEFLKVSGSRRRSEESQVAQPGIAQSQTAQSEAEEQPGEEEVVSGDAQQIVDLAGVEEGQEYELIVSNGEGLWRYKVGDLLRCTGFYHHGAPKFRVLGRKNVILSVHTDKTQDRDLQHAVTAAAKLHLPTGTHLYDFTSCVSLAAVPGHYVLFWELGTTAGGGQGEGADGVRLGEEVLAAAAACVEAGLGQPYRKGRRNGFIAPLEIRVVRPGTFDAITRSAVSRGAMNFKVPRGLRAGHPYLDVLNAAVVEVGRSSNVLPPEEDGTV